MEQQQQGWGFQTPDSMYASSQYNSPFAANISSFFRRPAKIVKPVSRNSSPRHPGRRRTTANVPISRTRSVLDRQRSSMPHQVTAKQQTRPLSWHPNSQLDYNFSSQEYLQNMTYQNYFQPFGFYGTTSANGLVTPMSYAVADEPQIQELITPLEELSAEEGVQGYGIRNYNYQSWMHPDMSKDQGYVMDNMFPQTQPQQIWQWNHQTSMLDIPTAPSSPNFLPIQGGVEASPLSLDIQRLPAKEEDGEELVGMGLYDSPADVQSSSLLFGGGFGAVQQKKSLKLEESFEPAPESSEAGEDDEDDDGAEEDETTGGEEEQENHPTHYPIYQDTALGQTSTLAGQSFFFDSEQDIPPTNNADMSYMVPNGYQTRYPMYGWV